MDHIKGADVKCNKRSMLIDDKIVSKQRLP